MARFDLRAGARWLVLGHRWLGVATCLLFVVWFVSGLVMMYVRYPALGEAERLSFSQPLDWSRVVLGPEAAAARSGLARPGDAVLANWAGEPVYRFADGRRRAAVSAEDGRRIADVGPAQALAVAKAAYPHSRPRHLRTLERDQWTVTSRYDGWRPLQLVALGDDAGTQLYVSARTGEIVLDTSRAERVWNWVGATPHWLYFTALRRHGEAWSQVVLWTSGVGIAVALSGLVLGVIRLSVRRRYRGGRISPFRGWMRWHHLTGLAGGVVVATWVFSGWMSMDPGGRSGARADRKAVAARWAGPERVPFDIAALKASRPAAREVVFQRFDGRPLALARASETDQRLLDGRTGVPVRLEEAALAEHAAQLLPGAGIVRVERLTREDAYWYGHHRPVALPVLRVVFDDPRATWIYLDPSAGRIAGVADAADRADRWTFAALHRLDLPGLRIRPLWDVVVISLLALGLAVSATGAVVGWRRLRLDFANLRRT